jgi:LPXTG-motif cell wall-anchored protein
MRRISVTAICLLLLHLSATAQLNNNRLDSLGIAISRNADSLRRWQDSFKRAQDSIRRAYLQSINQNKTESRAKKEASQNYFLLAGATGALVLLGAALLQKRKNSKPDA